MQEKTRQLISKVLWMSIVLIETILFVALGVMIYTFRENLNYYCKIPNVQFNYTPADINYTLFNLTLNNTP